MLPVMGLSQAPEVSLNSSPLASSVANHMGNQKYGDWSNFTFFTPFNLTEHYHPYCLITDFTNQHEVRALQSFFTPPPPPSSFSHPTPSSPYPSSSSFAPSFFPSFSSSSSVLLLFIFLKKHFLFYSCM